MRPLSSALNLITNDERLEETIKAGGDDEGKGRRADVTCYREEPKSLAGKLLSENIRRLAAFLS